MKNLKIKFLSLFAIGAMFAVSCKSQTTNAPGVINLGGNVPPTLYYVQTSAAGVVQTALTGPFQLPQQTFSTVSNLSGGSNINAQVAGRFYTILTGSTPFQQFLMTNGQTIKVWVSNPSTYVVTWPGVHWPGAVAPVQSINNKTDIYTIENVNGTNYGTVVTNY